MSVSKNHDEYELSGDSMLDLQHYKLISSLPNIPLIPKLYMIQTITAVLHFLDIITTDSSNCPVVSGTFQTTHSFKFTRTFT